jgi:RNA polymerase sigma factor (sigma-70 family)
VDTVETDSGQSSASAVVRAAGGDEAAFALIVAEHNADMERVAYTVAGDIEMAHEAVAAAWPKAWRGLGRLRDTSKLRPWLISIAANEARQLVRAHGRRKVIEIRAVPGEEARVLPPGIDHLDLENALQRLDARNRSLLGLRYVAGLTSDEIAPLVGLSPNGVRTRLARLLKRLREELNHE